MLDSDTRRRIDQARNILVGKIPDPRSQLEQITIALIYKFIGDMDASETSAEGRSRFFSGENARFTWTEVTRNDLGDDEMFDLYAKGISTLSENYSIPSHFRKVFEGAEVPYRDPRTLKRFLRVINEFKYEPSELLGDTFEYLLSVLGTQADGGQFRTPSHITDFIVTVVDPQNGETILDPACGTASFLVSAYKHILRAQGGAQQKSIVTSQAGACLCANFNGYDISPEMVRLSLVNLFMHGFRNPRIREYDPLTSEERWSECADVIFANPPFMSPKGGIEPHGRFSIPAKRNELLFVRKRPSSPY